MQLDSDPRIKKHSDNHYTVNLADGRYAVDRTETFGWTISAPGGQFLHLSNGMAIGLPDADTAILLLLELDRLRSVA